MKCKYCFGDSTTKGYFVSDNGFKWRVVYCQACERVWRIGNSVPNVSDKAKVRYFAKRACKRKGGDAQ